MLSIDIGANAFFCSALAAALVPLLWPERKRMRLLSAGALGVAGTFACGALGFQTPWLTRFSLAGAGAILIQLGILYVCRTGARRSEFRILATMLLPALAAALIIPALAFVSRMTPDTFDEYLYAYDAVFGFQPGYWAARAIIRSPWIRLPCEAAYFNLAFAMTVVYVLQAYRDDRYGRRIFLTFTGLALLGMVGYILLPVVGSAVSFRGFPYVEPALDPGALRLRAVPSGYPRSCMPSLHTAWVLALYWFTRGLARPVRMLALLFAAATLFYTLACHYAFDMIVAVPVAAGVYLAGASTAARKRAPYAVLCFTLAAGWILSIRFLPGFAIVHRQAVVALAIGTIGVSLACKAVGSRYERRREGERCEPAEVYAAGAVK